MSLALLLSNTEAVQVFCLKIVKGFSKRLNDKLISFESNVIGLKNSY